MTAAPIYQDATSLQDSTALRLNPLSWVVTAGLATVGAVYAYIAAFLDAPPFLLIGTAIAAILIAVSLTGRRWTTIPAVVLVTVNLFMEVPHIANWHLHDVENGPAFAAGVVIMPVASVAVIVAGIAYTVQRYRGGSLTLPRWSQAAIVLVVGGALGGSIAAQAPHYGATARVSAAALDSIEPALVMADMKFMQTSLEATAGKTSTWRIDNADNQPHTFDIPGLDIRMTVEAGESGLVMFAPEKAGTYSFKCSIPGHEKMKGEIIVR